MKWEQAESWRGTYARSAWKPRERWVYLVVVEEGAPGDISGVCLTRIPESVPMHDPFASLAHAVANRIVLPLGRGPGRPAAEPEVSALAAIARSYAEQFDSGMSLPGYPRWQQGGGRPSLALTDGDRARITGEILPDADPGQASAWAQLWPLMLQRSQMPGPDDYNITYRPEQDGGSADGCRNC